MLKHLKNSDKIRTYRDWPKVKPGEILMIPKDYRLLENPPVINGTTWPDWWKNMPKERGTTMLGCKGIQDYLSMGITVPLWCDMQFDPMGHTDFVATPADSFFGVERFTYDSCEGAPINDGRARPEAAYLKLVSPYLYKTAPGYSMLVLPVAYEPDSRYEVLPAIVNTDYYHNLHAVIRVMTGESFDVRAGTPLYHLIPFKRNDKVKTIIMGLKEMWDMGWNRGVGTFGFRAGNRKGLYRKHQREADAGKCPMG